MNKPKWVCASVAINPGNVVYAVMIDSDGRAFASDVRGVVRLPDPPPIEEETPTPRQPLTEWPGPGEEPPGLWVHDRCCGVPLPPGRFVLVPGVERPVWVCERYSEHSEEFEDGDRFIPVEDV